MHCRRSRSVAGLSWVSRPHRLDEAPVETQFRAAGASAHPRWGDARRSQSITALYAFGTVHLGVLGPLLVSGPTGEVAPTGRNDRVVLTALAAWSNEALSADRLADALWGERPPRVEQQGPAECGAAPAEASRWLVDRDPAGRLCPAGIRHRYRRSSVRAVGARRPRRTLMTATWSLFRRSWRPRLTCGEGRRFLSCANGRRVAVKRRGSKSSIAASRRSWRNSSLRVVTTIGGSQCSNRWCRRNRYTNDAGRLLMVALYRCDRQADALRAYQRARVALDDVGLEPGPELVRLEQRVGSTRQVPRAREVRDVVVPVAAGDAVLREGDRGSTAVGNSDVPLHRPRGVDSLVAARRRARDGSCRRPSFRDSRRGDHSVRRSRAQDNGRWRVRGLLVGCRGVARRDNGATNSGRGAVAWGRPLVGAYGPAFGRGAAARRRLPRAGTEPGLTAAWEWLTAVKS